MENFSKQISSYNLFNYLLPGIVFSVLLKQITPYDLLQENIVVGLFLYYFIGLSLHNFGSLILKNFLEFVNLIKTEPYPNYIKAIEIDSRIESLAELSSIKRTFSSLFIALILFKLYHKAEIFYYIPSNIKIDLALFLLLCIFVYSYIKESRRISSRIVDRLS